MEEQMRKRRQNGYVIRREDRRAGFCIAFQKFIGMMDGRYFRSRFPMNEDDLLIKTGIISQKWLDEIKKQPRWEDFLNFWAVYQEGNHSEKNGFKKHGEKNNKNVAKKEKLNGEKGLHSLVYEKSSNIIRIFSQGMEVAVFGGE